MNSKAWYKSKTYYVNLIMVAAVMVPKEYHPFIMSPEIQALVFGGVNLILRTITKDKITIT